MGSTDGRAEARLRILLIALVAISVVHYADTWLRYDAYALNPSSPIQQWMIPTGWLLYTVVWVAAFVQLGRRRWWPTVVLLAIYSLSGLAMAMHYVDAPPGDYSAVQNMLISVQLAAGVAAIGSALWVMFARALPALR